MAGKKNAVKNGIVLVADLSPDVEETSVTDDIFRKMKESIRLVIQTKIFMDSPDDITIVSCGVESPTQDNVKEENISPVFILDDLKPVNWALIDKFEGIEGSETNGDWIAAAVAAVKLIHSRIVEDGISYEQTQVVLFTAQSHLGSLSEIEIDLISLLQKYKTEFVIISEESTSDLETDAIQFIQKINGTICSYDDLLAHSVYFQKKGIKGTAWNVSLDMGSNIAIPISGYIQVKEDVHLKWQERTRYGDKVERRKTFQKGSDDSSARVDAVDVIYGYKYGSKYLTFTSEEEHALKYQSGSKCLSLLAFVDRDSVPAHYYTGANTMCLFAQCKDGIVDRNAQLGLSAFVRSMREMSKVALVRRVYTSNNRVQIGVLCPRIGPDYECLLYHEMPFGDEYRLPCFPPLLTANSASTAEQLKAMDQLIDKFDLSMAQKAGEFAFNSNETYDPHSQYLLHLVASKALHPNNPLPGLPLHIRRLTEPPRMLVQQGRVVLKWIKELFPVESDEKNRLEEDELEKWKRERSDNSSPAVAFKRKRVDRVEIGTQTPIQDFQDLLRSGIEHHIIFREMEHAVVKLLRESGGTKQPVMARCHDCLAAYRQQAISSGGQSVKNFNTWIRSLRQELLAEDGPFHPFWNHYIVPFKLGLISIQESADSDIQETKSKDFFKAPALEEMDEDDDYDEDMMQLPL